MQCTAHCACLVPIMVGAPRRYLARMQCMAHCACLLPTASWLVAGTPQLSSLCVRPGVQSAQLSHVCPVTHKVADMCFFLSRFIFSLFLFFLSFFLILFFYIFFVWAYAFCLAEAVVSTRQTAGCLPEPSGRTQSSSCLILIWHQH